MPVFIGPPHAGISGLLARIPNDLPTGVDEALALGEMLGHHDADSTRDLWETLATLAAHDLGLARAIEPHLDAVAILAQAGHTIPAGRWGVFAAEGGDDPLVARENHGDWTISGTKLWCSLSERLDHALVTSASADGSRMLFRVKLRSAGVTTVGPEWVARGLTENPSRSVRFEAVAAVPVGPAGWYLGRPGFAWGGIGVAACWFGGAVALARAVHSAARLAPEPLLLLQLGAIDESIESARRALAEAATLIDTAEPSPAILAKRVRATVARSTEDVLTRVGHALGPAPLAMDAIHSKRVADLQLYVRQHHAERDLASLGQRLAQADAPW